MVGNGSFKPLYYVVSIIPASVVRIYSIQGSSVQVHTHVKLHYVYVGQHISGLIGKCTEDTNAVYKGNQESKGGILKYGKLNPTFNRTCT